MAYKKPQIVAKSAAKQTYVAGCPAKTPHPQNCNSHNAQCFCGELR